MLFYTGMIEKVIVCSFLIAQKLTKFRLKTKVLFNNSTVSNYYIHDFVA